MWPGRHNYQLNPATVLRDLYRLLSLIAGDESIVDAIASPNDALASLRDQFLADELIHLLVGTAVANRIQLDHWSGPRDEPAELSFQPVNVLCGELQPNVTSGRKVPLTFREACNKIIHAVHIVPETGGDPAEHAIGDLIQLRGERGSEAWQARLNVTAYVRASVQNFENAT